MIQRVEGSYVPLPEPACDGPAAKLYSAYQMMEYAKSCHENWQLPSSTDPRDYETKKQAKRIEQLRKGLFTARDVMRVMQKRIMKSDPEAYSWAETRIQDANSILSHDPGASTRVIGDQEYVDIARELDLLAELCVYVEYDPDIGKVPAYWKPKYTDFVSKLLGKTK